MNDLRMLYKGGLAALFVGLCCMLLVACGGSPSSSANGTASSSFHTALKTTDGKYSIQFSVTPNHAGINIFDVSVMDSGNGTVVTNVSVRLSTTMLDMAMGTSQVNLVPDGNGHFSAQGDLSMAGNWEIRIQLQTPDKVLHEASVHFVSA